MPIAERMQLAEGKPLPRKLFAAMAQQDCGQCGYLCETYSKAIAEGKEPKLNLCVPGGKETSRMLKRLLEETPAAAAPVKAELTPAEPKAAEPGTRDAPVEAIFRMATRLNGKGSEKDTRHVVFDIAGSGLALQARRQLRPLSQERSGACRRRAAPPCACRPISRSAASPFATR